jgi:hypothetical protein
MRQRAMQLSGLSPLQRFASLSWRQPAPTLKMGLRWWRDVLILRQPKRYFDNLWARKYWFLWFGRLGDAGSNVLKIR